MLKLFLPACLCLLQVVALAEFIELNDGTKVEGKILSVTSDSVVVEVQTSPTIREEKSYPRSEVAKVQRSTQDDVAFEEIAAITAPSTADDAAVYDAPLERVRSFMKSYAYSKHMPAARKLAGALESERTRIAGGEVKVDGQWISGAAAGPEKTELGGRIQLAKMKSASGPAPTPAAAARSMACARLPSRGAEPAIRCARERRMWCRSSARLARCEK